MVVMTSQRSRDIANADVFMETVQAASDAGVAVFVVRTREPYRCASAIQDIAVSNEVVYQLWTCTRGWSTYPDPRAEGADVDIRVATSSDKGMIDIGKALEFAHNAANDSMNFFWAMFYPQHWFDRPAIRQLLKDFSQEFVSGQHRLLLIVPDDVVVPPELEEELYIVDFLPPSYVELKQLWDATVERIEKYEITVDHDPIIQNSLGMTSFEFETALGIALVHLDAKLMDGTATSEDFVKYMLDFKVEAIKKSDLLELMPSVNSSLVGGFDLLKEWIRRRALGFSDEAKQYGIEAPKGILCVGPPGSGKSLMAKSIAFHLGVPLVKFDISKVFGQLVGASEGRMRSALKQIESMAPCVMLIDEIDKGFGGLNGPSGDSGVLQRVFGTFLTWLQDRDQNKSPVFVVMTANNVTGLPAELTRKGRLDEIFACTFPSSMERAEILRIHVEKRGHKLPMADLRKIAEATENFVGSELESIVVETLIDGFDKGVTEPTLDMYLKQANRVIPLWKSQADKVRFMNDWAKNFAVPASTGMNFDNPEQPSTKPVTPGSFRGSLRRPGPAKAGKKLDI